MATTAPTRKADARQLARELSREIEVRAEKLPAKERKQKHAQLLKIANRQK